jgi:hypothetical protein
MPERHYGPDATTLHDADDTRSAGEAGLAVAFLQQMQATGRLTPEAVAKVLRRQGNPRLRHAVLREIESRWGSVAVRVTVEAEHQLGASAPESAGPEPTPTPSSAQSMMAAPRQAAGTSSAHAIGAAPHHAGTNSARAIGAAPHQAGSNSAHAIGAAPLHASAPGSAQAPPHGAMQGGAHRSALQRALDLSRLGVAHLGAIEASLLPAYRRAVAAMDTAAVKALALQIVGGVARIVDAQAQVVHLVPQADTGRHAAMASTAATDPFAPDVAELASLTAAKAALDTAVLTTVPRLAMQVSPQWFGDQLVAGRAPESPPHVREVLVQLTYEAGLVVQLMDEADAIEALVRPTNPARGTSEQVTEHARADAVGHLERWRSRPINFMFLVRVLTQRGVWQAMQGVPNAQGHTAAQLEHKVFAQSKETGTTADVGGEWDADVARDALSYSATDWKVTDDEASRVVEMLSKAEPRARGELVKQLYRMGRLAALCEHLPWGHVKQLWESIQDPEASKLLEPYWASQGGGKSLGKRLEDQDHWYTTALSRFLDVATFGAKPRIDASYDAREAGLITDGAYWGSVTKAVGRAAFVAAATAATGGVAGELVAGASEGMGLAAGAVGRGATAVAAGATAGGVGNVAGHFIGDVYDQVLDGKQGFDSAASYGRSFGEGVALGGATAAVGLVASKYLAQGTRSLAQEAAASHPRLTHVLETARSVGVGVGVKLQTTVRDFLDMLGGPGAPPGFRFAYAGNPAIPARLASAPPTAHLWIVIRPLKDLNAPMKMEGGDRDGPLGEIERVEPGEEIAAMFDEFSSPERHRAANSPRRRPGIEGDEELSEFDDGYQIKSDRGRVQDPDRPTWQESERRATGDLGPVDFTDQRSFIGGKEVSRGSPGSTRPDNYSETHRLSVDVKNYEIGTIDGRTRLVNNVVRQMTQRVAHLPKGTRQGLVIDARGQTLTADQMTALRARIVRMSSDLVAPDDIVFVTE